jgi:phage virion morphogenesis protein
VKVDVKLDDGKVQEAFSLLVGRVSNLRPLMQELGEFLTETTKQRFETSTAPDGSRWAPNAPATYLAHLDAFKGSFQKDGRLSKRGATRLSGKKPLIGETGRLSSQINYRADRQSVEIGSGLVYAAVQQFGATGGSFGTTKRGSPIPWGDIPARPFLGLSAEDTAEIGTRAAAYLAL